jgi:hypothetical protein
VNGGLCYGSVLLDKELWQSLAAMNGRDVPWVHGCVLDHGHGGDHRAPAYDVGEQQYWLRWADTGPAHLDSDEPYSPGRHATPVGQPSNQPPPPPRSTTATGTSAHPIAERRSPAAGSQAEALRAIAAAIEHLADVIAAAHPAKPPRHNGIN